MPDISYENKAFALWLLNRLKWYRGFLTVGDGISLTLTPEHIGKITGLKFSGIEIDISDDYLETGNEKLSFIKSKLAFLYSETGIVEAAERYVMQDMPVAASKQQIDDFKIAFVFFVMGRFLAPNSEHPDGHTNFWVALHNPDKIPCYNWSAYVLSNLLDAARLVNWVIPCKRALSTVVGCTLILQIFYLDNIDLGQLNLPHDLLPRWQNFCNQKIKDMVQADMTVPLCGSSRTEFGRHKVLRQDNTCYIFGHEQSIITSPSGLTPSPPLQHTSKKRLSREQRRTFVQNDEDRIYDSNFGSAMPTLFETTPNLEPVLDFSTIIRNKYEGQVDARILDELKLYNARCLKHLHMSYRSLAASIVNENANIAMKLLESRNHACTNNQNESALNICPSRRRTYKEFFSGTDSSTEGEDNNIQCKISKIPIVTTGGSSDGNRFLPGPDRQHRSRGYGSNDLPDNLLLEQDGYVRAETSPAPTPSRNQLNTMVFQKEHRNTAHCPASVVPAANAIISNEEIQALNTPVIPKCSGANNYLIGRLSSDQHQTTRGFGYNDAPASNLIIKEHTVSGKRTMILDSTIDRGVENCLHDASSLLIGSANPTKSVALLGNQHNTPAASSGAVIYCHDVSPREELEDTKRSADKKCSASVYATDTPEPTIKMAYFGANVLPSTENRLLISAIDLNSSSFEHDDSSSGQIKNSVMAGQFSLSHWAMNLKHPEVEQFVTAQFLHWLSTTSTNDLDRNWIIHNIPRSIKITGHSLKDQFVFEKAMSLDLMDVSIRRMRQLDKSIYPVNVPFRWRHFLESDYAVHVLSALNPVDYRPIKDQFVVSAADYKISSCRMFFVPVFVNGIWSCYAWDLKCGLVFIIDPSVGPEKDDVVIKTHIGIIEQLASSLSCIIGELFTGWSPQFTFTKCVVLRIAGMPYNRNLSGLITLFAIWNFDGSKLTVDCSVMNLNKFRSYLLYQLMEMNDNSGWSPSAFVKIID